MTLKEQYEYVNLMAAPDPYWDEALPEEIDGELCSNCKAPSTTWCCPQCFVDSLPGVRHTINSP